jgi:nitroimidazol reductase NimA-like FMN-containing flavoprotein (pyridoxamine 5'-phosphate oxidase superfamily)
MRAECIGGCFGPDRVAGCMVATAMPTAKDIYRTRPTQAEIAEVLAQREIATLGTLNEDGSVHLAYVIFLFEEGVFRLETASVTRKARNIAARGTASIVVSGRASSGRPLMVEAEGAARIIHAPDAIALNRRVLDKYVVPDAVDDLTAVWSRFDDISIELTPTRWRSWTNTLLRAEAEAGTGRAYGEIWKPD